MFMRPCILVRSYQVLCETFTMLQDKYSNGIEAGIIFLCISINHPLDCTMLKSRTENSYLLLSCRLYKKQVKRKKRTALNMNSRNFLFPAISPVFNDSPF